MSTGDGTGTSSLASEDSPAIHFAIGEAVSCTDGACGVLAWVAVDPVARTVTHLAVEPKHRQGLGRLVPLELVESAERGVALRCTTAEFEQLDAAEETQFLTMGDGDLGYGSGQALSWPYYGMGGMGIGGVGMGMGGMGMATGGMGMGSMAMGVSPQAVVHDRVPIGEVEVKRGDRVHASDGAIGSVQGLVIDPSDHHVTHVLLQEGHLWGRKQVAIPIRAVTNVEGGIHVALTKHEVGDLPPVDLG